MILYAKGYEFSMEHKDYEFIHEEETDGTKRGRKKLQRFVLLMLSACVVIELAAAFTLVYYSHYIKKNMKISSLAAEDISESLQNIDDKDTVIDAGRYIVSISGINITNEWPEQQDVAATGMIVKKSSEIIIIADLSSLGTVDDLEVTFYNGDSSSGYIIAEDDILGITAIRVLRSDMEENVYNDIHEASFAGSSDINIGENIILMGYPYGKDTYVAYGNLTSKSDDVNIVDGVCHILATDITAAENINGFLINSEGRVIGIVNNSYKKKSMDGIVAALMITDLRSSIRNMAEGKKNPYLGIDGADVTDEVIRIVDEDMPAGVYVKDAIPDSPSYNAGILSGDIIVKINNKGIKDMSDIMSILNSCGSGSSITVEVMRKGRNEYKSVKYEIIV